MKKTGKQIGFLRGQLEALDISDAQTTRRFLSFLLDAIDELSDRVDENEQHVEELTTFTQELDDAVYDLEENLPSGVTLGDLLFGENTDSSSLAPQLSVVQGSTENDRKRFLKPALCGICGKLFLCDPSAFDEEALFVVCPLCGKNTRPQAITEENTPIAKPTQT